MAKFIKIEGRFRIYELDANECRQHGGSYPLFACWDKDDHENIGNMHRIKCTTEKIEDMIEWCQEHSYHMTINEARIGAKMTQKQLAELLGIPIRTIEDWEAGRRKPSDYVEKLVIQEINRISGGISPNIFDEIFLRFCGQRVTDQTEAQPAAQSTPFTQIGIFDEEEGGQTDD